jgi:hypothetical protein
MIHRILASGPGSKDEWLTKADLLYFFGQYPMSGNMINLVLRPNEFMDSHRMSLWQAVLCLAVS